MAMNGTTVPRYRVTTLEASYSGRALTVRCEVEPTNPSHAISLLLVRVDDPTTGNIYLNPCTTPNYGTPPPAGASLNVSGSTQLFVPSATMNRVRVGYFGFVTDSQGVSYDFDGIQIFDVSPE
jgi:hypothetical protein